MITPTAMLETATAPLRHREAILLRQQHDDDRLDDNDGETGERLSPPSMRRLGHPPAAASAVLAESDDADAGVMAMRCCSVPSGWWAGMVGLDRNQYKASYDVALCWELLHRNRYNII